MRRSELQEIHSVKNTKYFMESYLKPAMEDGIIEMTIPERRNSMAKPESIGGAVSVSQAKYEVEF